MCGKQWHLKPLGKTLKEHIAWHTHFEWWRQLERVNDMVDCRLEKCLYFFLNNVGVLRNNKERIESKEVGVYRGNNVKREGDITCCIMGSDSVVVNDLGWSQRNIE